MPVDAFYITPKCSLFLYFLSGTAKRVRNGSGDCKAFFKKDPTETGREIRKLSYEDFDFVHPNRQPIPTEICFDKLTEVSCCRMHFKLLLITTVRYNDVSD